MDEDSIAATLRVLGRELVRELGVVDSASSPSDISLTQCHVLVELERHGTLTANELTDLLIVDKAAISRTVSQLVDARLISLRKDSADRRKKPLALTSAGMKKVTDIHKSANRRVLESLMILDPAEQQFAVRGMALYVKALNRSRLQKSYVIRPLAKGDNPALTWLIRAVLSEFGAGAERTREDELELSDIQKAYGRAKALFYVVETNGRLVGCGGIRAVPGKVGIPTCELRRMYLLPEARGLGLGRLILRQCLEAAESLGYQRCYLEIKSNMVHAQKLYERFGFVRTRKSLSGEANICDLFYMKEFLPCAKPARSKSRRPSETAGSL